MLLLASTSYSATTSPHPTAREFLQLPVYCQAKLDAPGVSDSDKERWKRFMGENWYPMTHFCLGLNFANRANQNITDVVAKRFNLQSAVGEFKYMIDRMTPDWPYRGKILVENGRILERQGRRMDAIAQYRRAIAIQPEYVRAYTALSRMFEKQGDVDTARQVLLDGLQQSPDSKSLKRRLGALGQ